jgi:hypothetical protein
VNAILLLNSAKLCVDICLSYVLRCIIGIVHFNSGYLVGYATEPLQPDRIKIRDYFCTALFIMVVGGLMYLIMKLLSIDPMWSVVKAEQYCLDKHAVRHKHNVWASFIRCANTILGSYNVFSDERSVISSARVALHDGV